MIQTTTNMRRRRAALVLAASALAWSAASAADGFPETPRVEVRDSFFGTELADPYRWLEDVNSPQTGQWMKAAAAHADRALAAIPGRDALLARIGALESGAERTIGRVLRLPGELYVYESRAAQETQFSLVMRRGLKGEETVLVDIAALSKARGVPVAINYFSLSPNARYLAYGVSERGSEAAVLHLLDVQTGQPVGEPITRADFGVARWAPNSRHFSMVRLRDTGADSKDKYQGSASWLVPVDGGFAKARELLGPGTRSVAVDADETPTVLFTADGRWLIGLLEQGVRRESRIVIAPAASLADGEPAWSQRVDRKDKVVDLAFAQGVLYAVTHEGAPRYRIIAAPIESFSAASARAVVPQTQRVLGMIVAARDALYFEAREANAKQLWRLPHAPGAKAVQVPLPVQGNFALRQGAGVWAAHPLLDGVLIGLEGWTNARQLYLVAASGAVQNTGLQPAGRYDTPTDIETRDVLVTSHDGARVPLSIVYRKGTTLNGRNPTLLQGYGAYGFSWEPRFDVTRLAWLERGGVIAMANPRGSGIFGRAWYEAGKQATKPNTWRDMIACAEYLVEQGYASPATLAIEGASAGGITSGRAATVRPDLFAAVVPHVGVLDTVRMELEANGPPNIPEFGTHTTEAGFKALLAMSTYHHIHPGVRYPAVLLTHGVNDPRVAVWQSTKTAARFAAAAASVIDPRPVLLRLDYDAGHGVGSSKLQRQRERVDIYAFLLWQMGVPGFQPDPTHR